MQFVNLTPFPALCFAALDKHGVSWRVVVMKVSYRLVSTAQGWQAQVIDDEPPGLTLADEPWPDADASPACPGAPSMRLESDLAPAKPRCDVVVIGHSHAPQGRPARQWEAGLRVLAVDTRPRVQRQQEHAAATKAVQERPAPSDVLLDKRLRVSGPHRFLRLLLIGYEREKPQPATRVALRWEHAFGGSSHVAQPADRGTPRDRSASTQEQPPLLNEVCFSNPSGCGWAARGWMRARRKAGLPIPDTLPAPQLEAVGTRQRRLHEEAAPKPAQQLDARAMRDIAAGYPYTPNNFGFMGRAWAPRLALAGTYDEAWAAQEESLPPQDFDDAYWNGAPQDQQIDRWPQAPHQACIELTNLCDPSLDKSLKAGGVLRVLLPQHRPFVLMHLQGGDAYVEPLVTDTVVIDTDAMTVSLTHRVGIPDGTHLKRLEARFETRPEAPLLRWAEDHDEEDGMGATTAAGAKAQPGPERRPETV